MKRSSSSASGKSNEARSAERWLGLGVAFYVAHLVEEALTRMYDDPLIVAAFLPFSHLSARHAAYAVLQVSLAVALTAALLFSAGGRSRVVVAGGLVLALLAESHHAIRGLATLQYNSGLLTSFPLPLLGLAAVRRVVGDRRAAREAVLS
jgi:hypothetical protein